MMTQQYQAHLQALKNRSIAKNDDVLNRISRDMDTKNIHGIADLRANYIEHVPQEAAETMALLFAAMSAELTKKALRDQAHKKRRSSPHEEYLFKVGSAPSYVVNLMEKFHLDRQTAISETADFYGLTAGIVEKTLVRAAQTSLQCRRIEVERLLTETNLSIPEIARKLGVDRTTIWRDAIRIRNRQEWPRLGRPTTGSIA